MQAGRQGQQQLVWPGLVGCKSVGMGKHRKPGTGRWRHGQALPGASMHGQDANRKIREKKRKKWLTHIHVQVGKHMGTDRHRSCLGNTQVCLHVTWCSLFSLCPLTWLHPRLWLPMPACSSVFFFFFFLYVHIYNPPASVSPCLHLSVLMPANLHPTMPGHTCCGHPCLPLQWVWWVVISLLTLFLCLHFQSAHVHVPVPAPASMCLCPCLCALMPPTHTQSCLATLACLPLQWVWWVVFTIVSLMCIISFSNICGLQASIFCQQRYNLKEAQHLGKKLTCTAVVLSSWITTPGLSADKEFWTALWDGWAYGKKGPLTRLMYINLYHYVKHFHSAYINHNYNAYQHTHEIK